MKPEGWMSRYGRDVVVAAAICALGVYAFWPVFSFAPDVSGRADAFRYFAPVAYYFDRALGLGDFPTWNALTMAGNPFAANPQSAAFYPPFILRSLMVNIGGAPTPGASFTSVTLLVALHVLLLGLGTARLARAHGVGLAGMVVAGLVGAFSAAMVRRMAEFHFLYALAWLPWMLLCARYVIGRSRAGFDPAILQVSVVWGIILGLSVLGGFPQIFIFMMIAMVLYIGVMRLAAWPKAGTRVRTFSFDVFYGVVAAALGVGISLALLLPAAEFNAFSPRAAGSGFIARGYETSAMSVEYVLKCMVSYGCDRWEFQGIKAAGALALLLALSGLFTRSLRVTLPYVVVGLGMMDISTGGGLIMRVMALVSPMQLVSLSRSFDIATIPLAVMAALGLDAALNAHRRAARVRRAQVILYAGLGAGLVAALYGILTPKFWLPVDVVGVMAVVAAGAVTLVLIPVLTLSARGLAAALALLLFCELAAYNAHYAPRLVFTKRYDRDWVKRSGYTGDEGFPLRNRRIAVNRLRNYPLFGLEALMTGYDPAYLADARAVMLGDQPIAYLRVFRANDAAKRTPRGNLLFKRFFWLAKDVVEGPLEPKRMFPPTTTVFVDDATGLEDMRIDAAEVPSRPVADGAKVTAWSVPKPVTRARGGRVESMYRFNQTLGADQHRALRLEVETTATTTFNVMQIETAGAARGRRFHGPRELNVAATASHVFFIPLLDEPTARVEVTAVHPKGRPPVIKSAAIWEDVHDEGHLVKTVERLPDSVEVSVDAPGPRVLVYLDADFPGWSVWLDDAPAPLLRVDGAFKGVRVPAGAHRVRFVYTSRTVHKGVAGSLVVSVVAAALWLWARRRRRDVA